MPVPTDNEIVIHNKAVAINPADWGVQNMGVMNPDYPLIGGSDAAGEIAAVGSAIKKFKVGDRVVALVGAYHPVKQDNSRGAFQLFSKTDENCVAKIPDNISFAEASVLPLCFSVAASGLFGSTTLGLKPLPYINPKPTRKVVLIWGGSSSVGACAIQLAIGAGYEVATTAGILNLDYCKSLGAKYVFDRSKSTVVEDVVAGLKNQDFGGAFCAGTLASEAIQQCGQIAHQLGGHKFVSTVKVPQMPLEQGLPDGVGQSAGEIIFHALTLFFGLQDQF
jgi:NADPH:quinone reductase-like Zn-dependent oxidoreductase